VATWARLRDLRQPSDGGPEANTVLFLNTHWDYAGKRARTESARLIRRTIRSRRHAAQRDRPQNLSA